ncbi:hypothetical protein QYF36_005946 [Acer negundo]|nr:hypothetical protein QYF36_005946 [Acer negundo]
MFDLLNDCNFANGEMTKRIVVARVKVPSIRRRGIEDKEGSKSSSYKKRVKCYQYGKLGHIKMNCCVKLTEGNLEEKVDNLVHHVEKDGFVVINDGGGDIEITINCVYQVPKVKKSLFSIANAIDFGNYLLFWHKGVNFLRNLKKVEPHVIHSGK